jgi:Family of unknown function (DUF6200)
MPRFNLEAIMTDNGNELLANTATVAAEILTPVIVPLGKKKKKVIKRLKRGEGKAMDEVMDVIEQVQANLGAQANGKAILPVVVIYSKKERKFRGLF